MKDKLKIWNKWRKSSTYGPVYKFLVLIGKNENQEFELLLMKENKDLKFVDYIYKNECNAINAGLRLAKAFESIGISAKDSRDACIELYKARVFGDVE